jgi:glycerol uptake facilitator-like aquaporin
MWLTGGIDWFRATLLTIAQVLGAIVASALVLGFFPEPLNVNTVLSDGTSLARGFFIETALTMELVFTVSYHSALDTSADIADSYARQRKAQGHIHCTGWDWPCPFYC